MIFSLIFICVLANKYKTFVKSKSNTMSVMNQATSQHPGCCSPVQKTDVDSMVDMLRPDSERVSITISNTQRLSEPAEKLRASRAFVAAHGHSIDDPKLHERPKCAIRAAALRFEGNRLYAAKKIAEAMNVYNESICAAPNDSEDLGMGFANRSAIYVQYGMYGVALANIALAKKHNYPDRLMAKLLDREAKCRRLDQPSPSAQQYHPWKSLNVAPHRKIPFLANGLTPQLNPTQGPVMIAERDFKVGDMLLHERPVRVCIAWDFLYTRCNYCLSDNLNHLIPCPNCASAMFCSEECMREGQRVHRFECGVTSELSMMVDWLGPRMFFHGLSLFEGDIEKMMEFCAKTNETDGSFYELDYSNYDALEEFKAFLTYEAQNIYAPNPLAEDFLLYRSAIAFAVYMKVPLVRSLIVGKSQEDFMLQCFLGFQKIKDSFLIMVDPILRLLPFTAGFAHSCDPKTTIINIGNSVKVVVTRPVRRGELIYVSQKSIFEFGLNESERKTLRSRFQCYSGCCEGRNLHRLKIMVAQPSAIEQADWSTLHKIISNDAYTKADKMNALNQFIGRNAMHYPQRQFADMVQLYEKFVIQINIVEEAKTKMQKIADSFFNMH